MKIIGMHEKLVNDEHVISYTTVRNFGNQETAIKRSLDSTTLKSRTWSRVWWGCS